MREVVIVEAVRSPLGKRKGQLAAMHSIDLLGIVQARLDDEHAPAIQPDHDLSHQCVSFAERGSGIVGMGAAYTAEQHRHSSHLPLKQAAGRWNLRLRIVSVFFAPLMRIISSIADDNFYLLAIAVDEELRGKGIGSILIDSIEEQARANGATRLTLDVSANNEGARHFYDRHGFAVESQWPKRLHLPALRFHRMTKELV